MKCPTCQTEFPLTWKRYLTAFSGKHTCPACREVSKLSFTWPYALCSLVPSGLLAGGLTFFLLWKTGGRKEMLFYAAAVSLTIGLSLDRQCDGALRKLKPLKRQAKA